MNENANNLTRAPGCPQGGRPMETVHKPRSFFDHAQAASKKRRFTQRRSFIPDFPFSWLRSVHEQADRHRRSACHGRYCRAGYPPLPLRCGLRGAFRSLPDCPGSRPQMKVMNETLFKVKGNFSCTYALRGEFEALHNDFSFQDHSHDSSLLYWRMGIRARRDKSSGLAHEVGHPVIPFESIV